MSDIALVIGASGISGSALVAELIASGMSVCATARYRSRGGMWETYRDRMRLIYADVLDLSSLIRALREASPRYVFYLAATVSVPFTNAVPISTYQTNVIGWVNMLEAIRLWQGDARVVWAGSGDQYGRSAIQHQPLTEDCPFKPTTGYAASKCAQDIIAYQYFDQWDLPIVRARTFHLAGPGQVESYAFASFAMQVARVEANQQEVIRHGNLDAARDYTDVRDVARAYQLLAESGSPGEAYNVCSGKAVRMADVLEGFRRLANCPIPTEQDPARMRPSEVPTVVGDNDKITLATGWTPQRSLADTLKDMLDYARTEVQRQKS